MLRWSLFALALAVILGGARVPCAAQVGGRLLVVSQMPKDKAAEGEPIDIGYYVTRSIAEAAKYAPTLYKPALPEVREAVQTGRLTEADAGATDSEAAMRRAASALGFPMLLFVSARQTKQGLAVSAQLEAMSGPEAWRTIVSRSLAAYRPKDKRGGVMEGLLAQAAVVAREVSEAPLDAGAPAKPAGKPDDVKSTPPTTPAKPADTAGAGKSPDPKADAKKTGRAVEKPTKKDTRTKDGKAEPPTAPVKPQDAAPVVPVVPRADPNAPTADEAQAARFRQIGDTTNVIFYLRRSLNSKPRDARLRRELIKAYRDAGLTDAAKSEAARAGALLPADPAIRRLLGESLLDAGEVDAAIREFQEAIRLDPKDTANHLVLGDALWNAGRPDEAEKSYATAAAADPTKPVPLRRLARVYAQRGRFADCANAMKAAIQLTTEAEALDLVADYAAVLAVVENGLGDVVAKLQRCRKDAIEGSRSREDVYKDVTATKKQAQDYSDFLAALPAPQGYASVQGLYLQAGALGVQAAEAALIYLESRSDSDDKDATLLRVETSKQIAEASKRLRALTSRGGAAAP